MPKPSLTPLEIRKIIELRQTGHSLPEIKKESGRGYGTVFRYIKGVAILPEYQELWRVKRGGSKFKAFKEREQAKIKARSLLSSISERDKLLVLAGLYWGEGTKSALNFINSDPTMVRVFVECLRTLQIKNDQLRVGIRFFEDMNKKETVTFWADTLKIPKEKITSFEIIKGKEKGKLKYGMCRVRVTKSKDYFKLIMAMIEFIKSEMIMLP